MAKTKTIASPISPETREHLYNVIRATAEPMTAGQLTKLLVAPHKLSEAKMAPILDELVAASRLHPFPPKTAKGKLRYWDRDAGELGRSLIAAVLDKKGAQSKTDLRKAAKQLTDAAFEVAFQHLIDARSLFEHPPLPKKKSTLFGNQPPSPEPYLRELGVQLAKVVAQLMAANVSGKELRRALVQLVEATGVPFGAGGTAHDGGSPQTEHDGESPQPEAGTDLVSLMRRIEPAADNGALVPARELRRVAKLDKSHFDRAVLELARQGRLMLHRHDFAGGLSDSERDELVTDGAGTYYVGMALRRALIG